MKIVTYITMGMIFTGCTPFVESNREETRLGIVINNQQAMNLVLSLFTTQEQVVTFDK